jgi:hypothetical protein
MSQTNAPAPADRSPAPPVANADRSFPLIALMQLATCWAALAACVDGAWVRERLNAPGVTWGDVIPLVLASVLAGGAIGVAIGFGQIRKWRSSALGFVAGGAFGVTLAAVYAGPAPLGRALAAAVLIVGTTILPRVRAA